MALKKKLFKAELSRSFLVVYRVDKMPKPFEIT